MSLGGGGGGMQLKIPWRISGSFVKRVKRRIGSAVAVLPEGAGLYLVSVLHCPSWQRIDVSVSNVSHHTLFITM